MPILRFCVDLNWMGHYSTYNTFSDIGRTRGPLPQPSLFRVLHITNTNMVPGTIDTHTQNIFIKEYMGASVTQGLPLNTITAQPISLNIYSVTNTNHVAGKCLSSLIAICL